jgi:hypothetical protein
VSRRAGRQLARLAGIDCDRWQPILSEVQTAERFADRAFRARQGRERFVVYFEAYTRWDRNAPWNLLAKAGLLSERERLPTRTAVFILLPRGYQPLGGQFRLEAGGAVTQLLSVREVPLWQEQPQAWWEETPALMPLYPLCRHGRRPREAVVHAATVIRQRVTTQPEQADELFLLNVFAGLAFRQLDVAAILGREVFVESRICQEIRREDAREAILRVLRARFAGHDLGGVEGELAGVTRVEQLYALLDRAATCPDLPDFRAGVPAPTRRR